MIREVLLFSNNTFADQEVGDYHGARVGRTAKTVQRKGMEIIISDFSGLKGRELTEGMKENTKAVAAKIIGRRDCVMVNLIQELSITEDSVQYIVKIQKAMRALLSPAQS